MLALPPLLDGVGEGLAHFFLVPSQQLGHPSPLSSARSVKELMERPVRRTPAKARGRSEESFMRVELYGM